MDLSPQEKVKPNPSHHLKQFEYICLLGPWNIGIEKIGSRDILIKVKLQKHSDPTLPIMQI